MANGDVKNAKNWSHHAAGECTIDGVRAEQDRKLSYHERLLEKSMHANIAAGNSKI
jgi:hypothetical protein